jgi:outer membrane protein TolC
MSIFRISFIFIFSIWFVSGSFTQETPDKQLNELIALAIESNPEIEYSYNQWKASQYKSDFASKLPNPVFTYGYFFESVQTRTGPQESKFSLKQKIPFPGKLGLKRKAAESLSSILKEKYSLIKQKIIRDIKKVYYDIFYIDKAIQTSQEEKSILESIEKVVMRKYELNLAAQQEVLKTQFEISKLIEKLKLLDRNRKSLISKLNKILNSKNMQISPIQDITVADFDAKLKDLKDISLSKSQDIAAARLYMEKTSKEQKLSKKSYFPDFTLGADYIQIGKYNSSISDNGKDAIMGMISVELPLWFGKINADVKTKEELYKSAEKRLEEIKNKKVYELEDIYFKITTQTDIVNLYKTALIPQAQQTFDSAKIGYQSGKVSFLDWLDSQRMLLKTKVTYYKAVSDYQKYLADLEYIIGGNWRKANEK